jgi:serine/threonine protein phosphatase 1
MRSYVVGDIHGCVSELEKLIEHLPLDHGDRVIFLGDYIDRGPDSKGVVSYLLDLQKAAHIETIFLKGNHEDMFLDFLGFPGNHGDVFLINGGQATLTSYGTSTQSLDIAEQLPDSHLNFYQNLKPFCLLEPYLCVHAGIQPLKKLSEQNETEMLWIRGEFIRNPHTLPFTVLFGHTPHKEALFDLPYKIGLDTGLVYGNKLSCLAIEEKVLYQVKRGAKTVQEFSVNDKWDKRSKKRAP